MITLHPVCILIGSTPVEEMCFLIFYSIQGTIIVVATKNGNDTILINILFFVYINFDMKKLGKNDLKKGMLAMFIMDYNPRKLQPFIF